MSLFAQLIQFISNCKPRKLFFRHSDAFQRIPKHNADKDAVIIRKPYKDWGTSRSPKKRICSYEFEKYVNNINWPKWNKNRIKTKSAEYENLLLIL